MPEYTSHGLPKPLGNENVSRAAHIELVDAIETALQGKETPSGAQAKIDAAIAAHSADTTAHGIGDKSTLLTTNKDTIVEAINELFTFANDGKTQIANAITAKGVSASPTETFASLAAKIGQINTGKKWAMGTASRSESTLPFTVNTNGSTINLYYITVTGLEFSPKTVLYVRDNNFFPGSVSIEAGWPTYNGYQGVNLTNQQIRLTGNAYISANGFQLPVNDPATTWYWIAFE